MNRRKKNELTPGEGRISLDLELTPAHRHSRQGPLKCLPVALGDNSTVKLTCGGIILC